MGDVCSVCMFLHCAAEDKKVLNLYSPAVETSLRALRLLPIRDLHPIASASTMFGRVGGHTLRCAARSPVIRRKFWERSFSTQIPSSTSTAAPSSVSPLGSITTELDRIAPCFEVPASRISILDSPASFYTTLKVRMTPAVDEVSGVRTNSKISCGILE